MEIIKIQSQNTILINQNEEYFQFCIIEANEESKIKIQLRNSNFEGFKYEMILLLILEKLVKTSFFVKLQIFEKCDDFELFKKFLKFFEEFFGNKIDLEISLEQYRIVLDGSCVLESFII